MPELPEVESVVVGLRKELIGCVIQQVRIFKPLVLKTPINLFWSQIRGQTVKSVSRYGKSIFLSFSPHSHMKIHLGMSGALLLKSKSESTDSYVRISFELDHPALNLVFRDVRQFGKVQLVNEPFEKKWGPDAWASKDELIFSALRKKSGMIKHALLNQLVIAGIGNIYADESLFVAKIHPKKRLEKLKDEQVRQLCKSIRMVLGNSIKAGGTTFRDYQNAEGKRGRFSIQLNVYGKAGKPCPNCTTHIKKTVVASRGTHFCPTCQKR